MGAKLNSITPMIDIEANSKAMYCPKLRLEPVITSKKYKVGKQIASVIKYNTGSLMAEATICNPPLNEPIIAP
ncbi:hypothetical protein [Coleofasciculus sp. H7-2]|uniref:hypothetical protein n=1 Tax=Coleofasciculus sp. H7-2 TaxID=3351545 RepID=UPI00366A8206